MKTPALLIVVITLTPVAAASALEVRLTMDHRTKVAVDPRSSKSADRVRRGSPRPGEKNFRARQNNPPIKTYAGDELPADGAEIVSPPLGAICASCASRADPMHQGRWRRAGVRRGVEPY